MTVPLILLAIPSIFLGMRPRAAVRGRPDQPVARAGLPGVGRAARPRRGGVPAVRHRRRADPRERRRRRDRHRARRGACSASRSAGSGCAPQPERVRALSARVPFLYRASLNKWWFDELNHLLFIVIGGRVAAFLWWFDRRVIDDTVNDLAAVDRRAGRSIRRVQTGRVQNYALGIAIGLIVMAGSFLFLAGR